MISLLFLVQITNSKNLKKQVPQGEKLENHYGQSNIGSIYGPDTDNIGAYVEANPETFTPFNVKGKKIEIIRALNVQESGNPEKMLIPYITKSGDFTNVAPSATKIIKPELASNFHK